MSNTKFNTSTDGAKSLRDGARAPSALDEDDASSASATPMGATHQSATSRSQTQTIPISTGTIQYLVKSDLQDLRPIPGRDAYKKGTDRLAAKNPTESTARGSTASTAVLINVREELRSHVTKDSTVLTGEQSNQRLQSCFPDDIWKDIAYTTDVGTSDITLQHVENYIDLQITWCITHPVENIKLINFCLCLMPQLFQKENYANRHTEEKPRIAVQDYGRLMQWAEALSATLQHNRVEQRTFKNYFPEQVIQAAFNEAALKIVSRRLYAFELENRSIEVLAAALNADDFIAIGEAYADDAAMTTRSTRQTPSRTFATAPTTWTRPAPPPSSTRDHDAHCRVCGSNTPHRMVDCPKYIVSGQLARDILIAPTDLARELLVKQARAVPRDNPRPSPNQWPTPSPTARPPYNPSFPVRSPSGHVARASNAEPRAMPYAPRPDYRGQMGPGARTRSMGHQSS